MSHIGIAILVLAVTGTLGAVMGMAIVGVVALSLAWFAVWLTGSLEGLWLIPLVMLAAWRFVVAVDRRNTLMHKRESRGRWLAKERESMEHWLQRNQEP